MGKENTRYSRQRRSKDSLSQKVNNGGTPRLGKNGCPLCADRSIPENLNAHVNDDQTCADVHLQLAMLRYDNAMCAVGQEKYEELCCTKKTSIGANFNSTLGIVVGAAVAGIFLSKIFATRRRRVEHRKGKDTDSLELPGTVSFSSRTRSSGSSRSGRNSSVDLEMPSSHYVQMDDSNNRTSRHGSGRTPGRSKSSLRSHGRSRPRDDRSRGRARSQSRPRPDTVRADKNRARSRSRPRDMPESTRSVKSRARSRSRARDRPENANRPESTRSSKSRARSRSRPREMPTSTRSSKSRARSRSRPREMPTNTRSSKSRARSRSRPREMPTSTRSSKSRARSRSRPREMPTSRARSRSRPRDRAESRGRNQRTGRSRSQSRARRSNYDNYGPILPTQVL